MSSSPCFLDPIVIPLIKGQTLLDVGCGYGRWGSLVQTNYWETGGGQPMEVDGFDAFEPNITLCRTKNVYRKVWHQQLPSPLAGSWDTVLACEVLEHLDQADVPAALDLLESVATQRIICTSPNWPYFRGGSDTIVGWNEFDAHKAHIPREYLLERGYKIVGAGFGNPHHPVVHALQAMSGEWKAALELLPRLLPELAHTIVAYKDLPSASRLTQAPGAGAPLLSRFMTSPDGRRFLVPADETPGEFEFVWNEIYGDIRIYDHPQCTIARDDVVLDLGANVGIFALRALETFHAGLVVCVEADETNAACLLDNLERHGFGDQIGIVNRAVYSHGDGVTFDRVPHSPCCHFVSAIYPERANPANQRKLPSVTVDAMVEELGLERVDFIKSDTEGCEVDALLGASQTIKRFKPKMIITTYHRPHHAARIHELVMAYRPDYRTELVDKGISDQVLVCW